MQLIDPENLPDDLVIMGSNEPTQPQEEKRECYICHLPCYVSTKNAFRKAQFMCQSCALADPNFFEQQEIGTTTADIEEFLRHIGIPVNERTVQKTFEWMQERLKEEVEKRKQEIKEKE